MELNVRIHQFCTVLTSRMDPTLEHFHLSFMCKFVASMDTPRGLETETVAAFSLRLVITLDL